MKRLTITTMLLLATTSLVWAQAPAASDDPHHPPQSGTAQAPAPTQPAAPPSQASTGGAPANAAGGMPMMMNMPMLTNMMSCNMPMNMIGMMQMVGMAEQSGMAMIDRVEGRIAFLRTELKITDAQTGTWNAFAAALRANAKKLGDVRASMMNRMVPRTNTAQRAPTLVDRLNLQEQWLLARIDGVSAIKSALTGLLAALSEDQKKIADDLLVPHMGMGMGTMTGMSGPMQQPAQMQPGPMRSGPMRSGQGQR